MGNGYVKGGLLLAIGGALGAIATMSLSKSLSKEKFEIKPALAELLAGGIGLKEKALTVYEKAREDVEDIIAGAEQLHRSRSEAADPDENASKAVDP